MAFTQSELYSLAKSVGLTDSRAKVAAAVAMAESKGDPNAHNTTPPDDSYGLWQINMYGELGPRRRAQLGLSSNTDLLNPQTNARAMKSISQDGGNFSPWSTYTDGSYLRYKDAAVSDQSSSPGFLSKLGRIVDPLGVGGTLKNTDEVLGLVGRAAVWTSDVRNWIRVGYVVAGGVIFVVGLVMVVGSTKAGQVVGKTAVKAATKGIG